MAASWRCGTAPELLLDVPPGADDRHAIEVENRSLRNGRSVLVEYLPAPVHLNGFDAAGGVPDLRLCRGTLCDVTPAIPVEGCPYGHRVQTATIRVDVVLDLDDIERCVRTPADDADFGDELLSGAMFVNLYRVERWAFVSWSSDSYLGEEYLLAETGEGLDALYCRRWSFDGATRVRAGRVGLPARLSDRLRAGLARLSPLGDRWSGHRL